MTDPQLLRMISAAYPKQDADFEPSSGSYTEDPCPVCGMEITRNGKVCGSCQDGLEYDRLERESGR